MSKRCLYLLGSLLLGLAVGSPALATGISVQVGDAAAVNFEHSSSDPDPETGASGWIALDSEGNPIFVGLPGGVSWGGEADGVTLTGLSGLLKDDPFVTLAVGLTNPTNAPQTYTITVDLPITPFNYNATVRSSVGVTVTDSLSGSVSASSVSGTPIYAGTVNGLPVLSLFPDPSSISCNTSGCSTTDSDNSGLPLLAAGPGVANSIGITLTFTLSAFDQVGITSRFEIVPEPTAAVLVGVGLLGLALARRRAA